MESAALQQTVRRIDVSGFDKPEVARAFGSPARLEWIAISKLVIDPEYQREISAVGRKNILRITRTFSWSMFAPVIVSEWGGSQYAIVDGQHRTTAAALCGIERVPCCVIEAKRQEQAAAFRAINSNITKIHSTSLLRASIAAGEPEAMRMANVAKRAGVTILNYPMSAAQMKPGQTIAVAAVRRIIHAFGDEIAVQTLRLVSESGGGIPGSLKQQPIIGTAEVLNDHPDWRAKPEILKRGFADLDMTVMTWHAQEQAAKRPGVSAINMFEAALVDALTETFKGAAA